MNRSCFEVFGAFKKLIFKENFGEFKTLNSTVQATIQIVTAYFLEIKIKYRLFSFFTHGVTIFLLS